MTNMVLADLPAFFADVIWAWYATCLPCDRAQNTPPDVTASIRDFMSSPAMASVLLHRFEANIITPLRPTLRQHAQRYLDAQQHTSGSVGEMSETTCEAFGALLDHQVRTLHLPTSIADMQQQLRLHARWIWAKLTPTTQQQLTEMAASYAEDPCFWCLDRRLAPHDGTCTCARHPQA